ncbi:hypothetical protein D3C86_2253900 [compost metagenome]
MSRLIDQVMDQRVVFSFTKQPLGIELLPQTVFTLAPRFTPRVAVDDIFHPPLV